MLTKSLYLPIAFSLIASGADAPDLKTVSGATRNFQTQLNGLLRRTAEKMPEENYAFKPTPEVRSFGELIGHIADAEHFFCSAVAGDKAPAPETEKTKKTKAEISAALQESLAYCDKVYDSLNDKNIGELIKVGQNDRTRNGLLTFNTMHAWEHYGNLVTYMRLKNVVPPSTEPKK